MAGNVNSATSQFFICVATASQLNGQYTIYGHVTSGMSVADTIVNSPRNMTNNMPLQKIDMFVTYMGSNDTIPQTPVLNTPQNNTSAVDTTLTQLLKWNTVSNVLLYNLHVSTDSLFSDTVIFANITGLSYPITNTLLAGCTSYYWHVRTNNGGNFSTYSPTWKFSTECNLVTTGISANTVAPAKTSVFPNPGSGKFTFSGFEKGSLLQVFNPDGRLVHETILKENNTLIDLEGKGTYIYKIKDPKSQFSEGKVIVQ